MNLDQILKDYYPDKTTRKQTLQEIVHQFEGKGCLSYSLTNTTSLILTKDEKRLNKLRKYKASPFPLLSNVELFSNSIGEWDKELIQYGIKSRSKDPSSCGTNIYLMRYESVNALGNKYLKQRYARLERYRNTGAIKAYWSLSWRLMSQSSVFRLSCLNSWQPRWYKELSAKGLSNLWRDLHSILSLATQTTIITNVWIESPKNKWRQLGIPPRVWRLYLHMLNIFISYIYSPHLDPALYDGFIYNRGCKSWWENLLWSPLLDLYSWILEVDLSSGFPNLSLHSLEKALHHDGLIPPNLINLILNHLKSPLKESTHFPTFESYLENKLNRRWRQGNRSVHMGLGISPILFVITVRWALQQIPLLQPRKGEFTFKGYADDFSFYFNLPWLYTFYKQSGTSLIKLLSSLINGENPILTYLNSQPLLQSTGIKFCLKKSSLVRVWGIWLKPYKSLGLSLYTTYSILEQIYLRLTWQKIPLELKGSTRGRGANPVKRKSSTLSSNERLNYYNKDRSLELNLARLLEKYRPYFGLLMSKLYYPALNTKSHQLQDKISRHSLLGYLNESGINKLLPKSEQLNLYNSGSKLNELMLNLINKDSHPLIVLAPNLKRMLKYEWPSLNVNILKEYIINKLPPFDENSNIDDHFYKFSELELSDQEIQDYKLEYEAYLKKHRLELPNR